MYMSSIMNRASGAAGWIVRATSKKQTSWVFNIDSMTEMESAKQSCLRSFNIIVKKGQTSSVLVTGDAAIQ